MLTRNLIESEISLAYLHAVAAKVAFAVDVPHIDSDSVDATISAKGLIHPDSKLHAPRIEVQLKATFTCPLNDEGNYAFSLPIKNYDELRVNTALPRLLVLFILPDSNSDNWVIHDVDKLVLQKCAFYLNLKGLAASSNAGHQTVYVPAINALSPSALNELMIKASKGLDL